MPVSWASGVPSRLKSPLMKWKVCLSGPRTGPSSPSRIFQLIVRIRKLVKNGAMTRNSSRLLWRPPRNAIVYATGKPMSSVRIVAAPPNRIELRNCLP